MSSSPSLSLASALAAAPLGGGLEQLVQIVGSVLVLVPFALVQARRWRPESRCYLLVNACGSGVLAVDAALTSQWGFLLLEGVWAVVSLAGLASAFRAARAARRGRGGPA